MVFKTKESTTAFPAGMQAKMPAAASRPFVSHFAALMLAVALVCAGMFAPALAFAAEAGSVVLSVVGVNDPELDKPLGELWVESQEVSFEEGTTAWGVLQPALDNAGCTYDAQDSQYGIFVQSITSPQGLMLENTSSEPYSFWSLLVNGEPATEGVDTYTLQDGDTIEFMYYPKGEAPVVEAVPTAEVISAELSDDVDQDPNSASPEAKSISGVALGVGIVFVAAIAVVVILGLRARNKGKKTQQ